MQKQRLVYAFLVGMLTWGQSQVDLRTQSRNVDFSGVTTKPIHVGNTLPALCGIGEFFFLSTAPAGANVYGCVATNTWVLEAGGGTAALSFQADGTTVGQRNIANLVTGAGLINVVTDTGTRINIQHAIDTSVVETKASAQAGGVRLCVPASASATAYTCAMSPTLTAYTTGMLLQIKPDVSGTGGATTLNIDTLGVKAVKLADGTTNPSATDLTAGRLYGLWYDGAAFRLQSSDGTALSKAAFQSGTAQVCSSASASGTTYTCAMSPTLTALTAGMVIEWKPDVTATGGATTLNIDTLGAKAVKLSDGATDPTAIDILAAQLIPVWYDGTVFRLEVPPVLFGSTATRPACAAAVRGRIWDTIGGAGVKDAVAVCAKDAADAYAWRVLY